MKLWSAWLPDVLPHVAGCPVPIVEHELRRTSQDFFTRSRAWQVTLAPVAVSAGDDFVIITPTDLEQEMVRIERAWYDGKQLEVYTAEQLDDAFSDDWETHTGSPSAVIQFTPGSLRLYPIPTADAAEGLKARISVRPSEASTGLPDEMYVKYRDAIKFGARGSIQLYPAKQWTNLDQAAVNGNNYNTLTNRAAANAAQSFGGGRISSRKRWF